MTLSEQSETEAKRAVKLWVLSWRRFKRNRIAVLGAFIVGATIIIAVFAPFIAPYPKDELFFYFMYGYPSREHPFGLDLQGHDMLTWIIFGARTALIVSFLSTIIRAIIGITVGSIAGYYGGRIDELLMRITDAFLITPSFLIIMILIKMTIIMIPRSPLANIDGLIMIIISVAIGILGWPAISRVIRGEFMRIRELEFIEAAKCLGQSERNIIFRHVFPNALPPIIVVLSMNMASAILQESALSFLGLGDPSVISWGWMLSMAQFSMPAGWWEALYPGLSLFFIVLGFNILGDGLNEALNPRLRD